MRPRAERGVLVGHASGAAAYMVHLPRLDKVVTSSAVNFDDIPASVPFLSQRPDHWESPTPGVDDASHLEEGIQPEEDVRIPVQDHHSIFDGRDIQRPKSTDKMTPPETSTENEDHTKMEEDMEQIEHPQAIERNSVCRDQLLDLFGNEDEADSFTCCMLADSSITVEEALASSEAEEWQDAIASEERGLNEKGVLVKTPCPENIRPLKTRYILTKKLGPDGSIIRGLRQDV